MPYLAPQSVHLGRLGIMFTFNSQDSFAEVAVLAVCHFVGSGSPSSVFCGTCVWYRCPLHFSWCACPPWIPSTHAHPGPWQAGVISGHLLQVGSGAPPWLWTGFFLVNSVPACLLCLHCIWFQGISFLPHLRVQNSRAPRKPRDHYLAISVPCWFLFIYFFLI